MPAKAGIQTWPRVPGLWIPAFAGMTQLRGPHFDGRPGERIIGYDNETGKGDHRHYRDREETYRFTNYETLIRDFMNDVRKERTR